MLYYALTNLKKQYGYESGPQLQFGGIPNKVSVWEDGRIFQDYESLLGGGKVATRMFAELPTTSHGSGSFYTCDVDFDKFPKGWIMELFGDEPFYDLERWEAIMETNRKVRRIADKYKGVNRPKQALVARRLGIV